MSNTYMKRKNYVVNRQFQFRLIATFLVSVLIALAVFSAATLGYYWLTTMAGENRFNEIFLRYEREPVTRTGEAGETEEGTMAGVPEPMNRWEIVVPPVLVNNLFIMIVVCVIGVFYSHRLAGPVFRMKADIQRALDGEAGVRIRLRQRDKFQDLAEKINELIEKAEIKK